MESTMLIHLLVWILVVGLIFYLAYWAIGQVPLPPPLAVAAKVVLAILVIVVILDELLPMIGPANCGRLLC